MKQARSQVIIRHSEPTALDELPPGSVVRVIHDDRNPEYFVQISADDANPEWILLIDFVNRCFSTLDERQEFINALTDYTLEK